MSCLLNSLLFYFVYSVVVVVVVVAYILFQFIFNIIIHIWKKNWRNTVKFANGHLYWYVIIICGFYLNFKWIADSITTAPLFEHFENEQFFFFAWNAVRPLLCSSCHYVHFRWNWWWPTPGQILRLAGFKFKS